MALKLVTAPTVRPVTVAEAKAYLNISHSDDDALLDTFVRAATNFVDGPGGFLGRALCPQTWDLYLDEFPNNEIRIPLPPLISVDQIEYDDTDGNEQVLPESSYTVDNASEPGWVLPGVSWPSVFSGINSVRIRFTAGYVSSSPPAVSVPEDIKIAINFYVGTMYANRENEVVGPNVSVLPWAAEQLLRRHLFDLGMA